MYTLIIRENVLSWWLNIFVVVCYVTKIGRTANICASQILIQVHPIHI